MVSLGMNDEVLRNDVGINLVGMLNHHIFSSCEGCTLKGTEMNSVKYDSQM